MATRKLTALADLTQADIDEPILEDSEDETAPQPGVENGSDSGIASYSRVRSDTKELDDLLANEQMSGGSVRIYRMANGSGRPAYVTEYAAADFAVSAVAKLYGGGEYQAKLYNRKRQFHDQFRFEVDRTVKSESERAKELAVAMPQQLPVQDNREMLLMMMQMQQQASDRTMQMMMEGNKTLATVMVAALGGRQKDAASEPVSALLAAATDLVRSRPAATASGPTILEQIETLRALKGLVDPKSETDAEPETTLDKVIRTLAPMAAPLIASMASRAGQGAGQAMGRVMGPPQHNPQQVQPQPPQQLQQGPPVPAPAATVQGMTEHAQILIAQLRTFEPLLVKSARENTPVESVLDLLDVALDDASAPILDEIMGREDWQTILFGRPLPPDVQPWMDSLRYVYTHPQADDADETAAGEPAGPVATVAADAQG